MCLLDCEIIHRSNALLCVDCFSELLAQDPTNEEEWVSYSRGGARECAGGADGEPCTHGRDGKPVLFPTWVDVIVAKAQILKFKEVGNSGCTELST